MSSPPPNLTRSDAFLLHRIQRHVPLEHTETSIAGQRYPWTQVVDPDRLLEQALSRTDRNEMELDPFWAATWRAAVGLERALDLYDISGKRVLELGCGSGRTGIGAALRGAQVTMTDVVGMAILVSRFNARHVKDKVTVRRLEWKNEQIPGEPYDYVIGSDIVYDPALHAIVEPCFRRHLARHGKVLLSEPQRHTGDRFKNWIQAAGWNLKVHYIDLLDNSRDIRIFELTL